MTPDSPLAELRDLHLPDPISWWPPAIGWWLLLGLLILLIILTYLFAQLRKRGALKRAALAELALIRKRHEQTNNNLQTAKELSTLLRRVCISDQPRRQAAALTGTPWLHYLDQLGECTDFANGVGKQLIEAPYQSQPAADIPALLDLCQRWLNRLPNRARH